MNKHMSSVLMAMAAVSLASPMPPHPTQAKADPWKRRRRGRWGHTETLAQRLGGKPRERRSR